MIFFFPEVVLRSSGHQSIQSMLNICLPIFPQQRPRSVLTTMLQLEELSVMTMQNAWREMVLLHANARKELLVMVGLSARAVFQVQMYLNI